MGNNRTSRMLGVANAWCCLFVLIAPLGLKNQLAFAQPTSYSLADQELTYPTTYTSSNGLLNMTIIYDAFFYSGHANTGKFWTRAYNGAIPGPLIRVRAGDTIQIHFENRLGPDPSITITTMNSLHMPNTTNLHTHGLHVSPIPPSDNVFITVEPGTNYDYVFNLPPDHAPGTHWFHAHHHGSVALQVGSGSQGSIIIDDESGTLPDAYQNMPERLLHFSEFPIFGPSGIFSLATTMADNLLTNNPTRPPASFILVNGYYKPRISMTTGTWYRFRSIWGGAIGGLNYSVNACDMKILAKDGVYLRDAPRTTSYVLMMPGNRVDVAVRCNQSGTFALISGIGGTLDSSGDVPRGIHNLDLLTLVVSGSSTAVDLPSLNASYPLYLTDLTGISLSDFPGRVNQVFHDFQGAPGSCTLNGLAFQGPDTPNYNVTIGNIQEWTLHGINNHPFHIHATQYQIQAVTHDYYKTGDWHDVLNTDGVNTNVVVRWQTDRYTGDYVIHCHLLVHEDLGCMGFALVQGTEGVRGPYAPGSITPSSSPSPSPSITASTTRTQSMSATSSKSASVSRSNSGSRSVSASPSVSRSFSSTISSSGSRTVSTAFSSSASPSGSPSPSHFVSVSISVSASATLSPTASPSLTGSVSASPSQTGSVSATPSQTRSVSASFSQTGSVSATPSQTRSVSASFSQTGSVSVSASFSKTGSISTSSSFSSSSSTSGSSSKTQSSSVSKSASASVSSSIFGSVSKSLTASRSGSSSVSSSSSKSSSQSTSRSNSASLSASVSASASGSRSASPSPSGFLHTCTLSSIPLRALSQVVPAAAFTFNSICTRTS